MATQWAAQKIQRSQRGAWLVGVCACCFLLSTTTALSNDSFDPSGLPWRQTRFDFKLGWFFPSIDSTVRFDSGTGIAGARIDLEEDGGLQSSDEIPLFAGKFRFAERHSLNAAYFKIERSDTAVASADIRFGDISVGANAQFATEFDTEVFRLSYEYAMLLRDSWELALLAGAHITKLDVSVNSETLGVSESVSTEAPLPFIGLKNYFRYNDRLFLSLSGEYLQLNFENIDGSIANFDATLQYKISRNVGIGGGLNYFDIKLDTEEKGDDLTGNYIYRGPFIFLNVGF